MQRFHDVRDRNRELEPEQAVPDDQQAAEQDRISWVEGELDRIAAAIREVREYIEWAREQAQARRAAGVERTRHPLDSYSNRTCATWIFGDCSLLHSCIGSSGESSPERNARR